VRICGRCGVYGPSDGRLCDGCGAELRTSARSVPTSSHRCASVRLEVRCASCGRFTPVPSLAPGRAVPCARCGDDVPLPERTWTAILDRAHAVADLLGEHPEGQEPSGFAIDEVNPFAAMARRRAVVVFAADEADALAGWLPDDVRARIAPGVPLGGDDYEPIQIRPESPGAITTRSALTSARYAVDVRAVGLHRQLLGVVADEHHDPRDEPDVAVVGATGARCPGCGAAFQLAGSAVRVRCETCDLVSHVPAALRLRTDPDPRPEAWWLVFDGPSPYRRFLERHPSTWDEPYPDERPLGGFARRDRAQQLLYALGVPTVVLLVVGALALLPGWLGR
jgi:hypothetical protein